MPRCTHCGKVNREGSLFCQDCGHRLEAAPKPLATGGINCSACGTANPPGMNFCKMCGTSLLAKAAPGAASQPTLMASERPVAPTGAGPLPVSPALAQTTVAVQQGGTAPTAAVQAMGTFQPGGAAPTAAVQPTGAVQSGAMTPNLAVQAMGAAQPSGAAPTPEGQPNGGAQPRGAAPTPEGQPNGGAQPGGAMPTPAVRATGGASAGWSAPTPVAQPTVAIMSPGATAHPATSPAAVQPMAVPATVAVQPAVASPGATAQPITAAAATSASSAPKAICAACGKGTPVGFSFCQHCGQKLTPATPGVAPKSAPAARAEPTLAVTPTPPAGLPQKKATRGAEPRWGENGASAAAAVPVAAAAVPVAAAAAPVAAAPVPVAAAPVPVAAALRPALGTLVAVNRDGTDGRSIKITEAIFDVGRTEGALTFTDDPYLAPRHLRLLAQGGKILLRPLDQINGVFLRTAACELVPGDSFLVGKELLRFEPLAPEERDPPWLVEHGVRLFGSAPREAWGRLRQLTVAGTSRDVWHLTRPELVLGREEGDVTFPDDEFMSRRHVAIQRVNGRARLEDLGSSNGTFVRVLHDRELSVGDLLRVGDQLLRFEL